ncbi:MAG TPA: molybdenum cofactor biosynthesis protein MoaE [Blastocatellia bacterium]|nr:molybdenum cofactor biosynthesis protein MoaE [Blastocatellia bacterium]
MTDDRIKVTVLLFGQAREWVGASSVELELPPATAVASAFDELKRMHPKMAGLERSVLFAVNEEYVSRDYELASGDQLAVLPPVSGGSSSEVSTKDGDFFAITHEPLDIVGLRKRLLEGSSGAVVVFDGVARNNTKGRVTRFLEYEGYSSMALRTMEQIAGEVREKWAINRIGIIHRLGRVEITESSVVIVVTSAHRGIAFEACRYAIDRLKKIVPIWKKEFFEDGEVWVEGEGR